MKKLVLLSSAAFQKLWANAPDVTRKLESVACDCGTCRELCHRAPCLGTPLEMARIMAAGHGRKLAPTTVAAWVPWGGPAVDVIAPLMTEHGCAFLNELGHCTLHDKGLKPMEGRLSSCQRTAEEGGSISMATLQTWIP